MANLSQQKREKLLAFLKTLREQHSDDESLMAIGQIERELTAKKYGLVWEEHEEEVDVMMQTHIPVFTEDTSREIVADATSGQYNFLLEGDNLHSLKLLEKTHRGKIDVIYIDPPYNTGGKDFVYDDKYVVSEDSFRHSKWVSF
ncbi:MAG TPA: site-specific DNA-methyltransferase, partial [Ruminococcus sp.]|nr:site-specific DNA-methyltransferase [Ruminococcus sp.]